MSDLHLESQDYCWPLPSGDILILAGDLCQARCFSPDARDPFAVRQKERVLRFADDARARFRHVLLVMGNHEHYHGAFSDTASVLRSALPGFVILDNETVEIGGVRFFGSTLWSDFEEWSKLDAARRRCGEFFFVKVTGPDRGARRFQPEDALAAFDAACDALRSSLAAANGKPTVVITHHAPSPKGLNPHHEENGLAGAYASRLDPWIEELDGVPVWIHGHTHIRRLYRIGATKLRTDARGFDGRDLCARSFTGQSRFEI